MWMKSKGLGSCARQLVAEIANIKLVDIVLPVKGMQPTDNVMELSLRAVSHPDKLAKELLAHLGLELPLQSRIIKNIPNL